MLRLLNILAGHVCVLLALIGIALPLLPTTPLLLLAAFFYARGSERLHQKLLDHPRLGPPIRTWQRYGGIALRAKLIATVMILISFAIPLGLGDHGLGLKALIASIGVGVLAFIWSRPQPPADETESASEDGVTAEDRVQRRVSPA